MINSSNDKISADKLESSDSDDDYLDEVTEKQKLQLVKLSSAQMAAKHPVSSPGLKLASSHKTKLISIRKSI